MKTGKLHCCFIVRYDKNRNLAMVCPNTAKWRIFGEGGEEDYADSCDMHLSEMAHHQADPKATLYRIEDHEEESAP